MKGNYPMVASEKMVFSAIVVGVCIVLGFLLVCGAYLKQEWDGREAIARQEK